MLKIGEKIPFDDIRVINKANSFNTFTRGLDGTTGAERVDKPFPNIQHKPKFKLQLTDTFFTIGSCFARNVEGALAKLGVKNVTAEASFAADLYSQPGTARNSALNAFTPHSMLSLVRLPNRTDRESAGSVDLGNGLKADMMTAGLRALNQEEYQRVRSETLRTYSRMNEADVFIITLGFTETWWDTLDDIYTNKSPGTSSALLRRGSRYKFENISPDQAIQCVNQVVDEIRLVTKDRARVVLTTSPVPLHRTWEERDVIVSNMYSKATLLAAANVVASERDYVDYFPSYEMVMYGDPAKTWMPDGVHVQSSKVQGVMKRFAELYFS